MSDCGYRYSERGQLKIHSRVNRCSLFLSEEERLVLLFILDRTIGWRKVWATISCSQFVNGVIRRSGEGAIRVASGTRLTPSQVDGALTRLLEGGAIEIERFAGKVAYKINEYWCHPSLQEVGMWELNESDYDYDEDTGGKRSRPVK